MTQTETLNESFLKRVNQIQQNYDYFAHSNSTWQFDVYVEDENSTLDISDVISQYNELIMQAHADFSEALEQTRELEMFLSEYFA